MRHIAECVGFRFRICTRRGCGAVHPDCAGVSLILRQYMRKALNAVRLLDRDSSFVTIFLSEIVNTDDFTWFDRYNLAAFDAGTFAEILA